MEHLAAGIGAGLVTTATLHPLDVVRMRFQVERGTVGFRQKRKKGAPEYRSTAALVRHVVQSQGMRGLYPGLGPALCGSGLSWGLFFLYERAKKRHMKRSGIEATGFRTHLASSVEAGILCVLLTKPIGWVKTRLALQQTRVSSGREVSIKAAGVAPEAASDRGGKMPTRSHSGFAKPYRSSFHAVRSIIKHEGFLALYKGVGPALMLVSHGVTQFCVYEELKGIVVGSKDKNGKGAPNPIESACIGAASKLIATTVTYPIQVVKARVQQRQQDPRITPNAVRIVRDVIRKEGPSSLYKGLGANLMRVAPAAAITFCTYEELVKVFRSFGS